MENRENAGNQYFLLFATVFSNLSLTHFMLKIALNFSQANAVNWDKSKILLPGRPVMGYMGNWEPQASMPKYSP